MMTQPEEKECVMCEKALAVFGILLGAAILFIAIDVLTGSKLSSMISGSVETLPELEATE